MAPAPTEAAHPNVEALLQHLGRRSLDSHPRRRRMVGADGKSQSFHAPSVAAAPRVGRVRAPRRSSAEIVLRASASAPALDARKPRSRRPSQILLAPLRGDERAPSPPSKKRTPWVMGYVHRGVEEVRGLDDEPPEQAKARVATLATLAAVGAVSKALATTLVAGREARAASAGRSSAAARIQTRWRRDNPALRRNRRMRAAAQGAPWRRFADVVQRAARRSCADRVVHFLAEAKRLPPFRRCIARLQRVCYMIQRVWRRQLARHRARLALYAKIWDAEVAAHYRALAKYAADLRDPGANEENEARAAALAPWRPGGVGETTKQAPGPSPPARSRALDGDGRRSGRGSRDGFADAGDEHWVRTAEEACSRRRTMLQSLSSRIEDIAGDGAPPKHGGARPKLFSAGYRDAHLARYLKKRKRAHARAAEAAALDAHGKFDLSDARGLVHCKAESFDDVSKSFNRKTLVSAGELPLPTPRLVMLPRDVRAAILDAAVYALRERHVLARVCRVYTKLRLAAHVATWRLRALGEGKFATTRRRRRSFDDMTQKISLLRRAASKTGGRRKSAAGFLPGL